MKRIFTSLALAAFLICGCEDGSMEEPQLPDDTQNQTPGETTEDEDKDDEETLTLAAPSDLVLEQFNTTTIKLSWTAPEGEYEGVVVERAGEDKKYSSLGTVQKGVTGYNDRTLTADGTYWYRIAAYSGKEYSEYVEASVLYSKVPAPTELKIEKQSVGVRLTWKDNCKGETAYLVRRFPDGASTYEMEKVLNPDVTTWTDTEVDKGRFEYHVIAKKEMDLSLPAKAVYENFSAPVVSAGTAQTSWYMVSVPITLSDDGGEDCEVGVCWVDGTGTPTLEGAHSAYPVNVESGTVCFANATNAELEYGRSYTFRVYAKNSQHVSYSASFTGSLGTELTGYSLNWADVSPSYGLSGSGVTLYSLSTTLEGNTLKAWYAKADISSGKVRFRAIHNDSGLATPSSMINNKAVSDVLVMVNGGYFDMSSASSSYTKSFSYVYDQGKEKSRQITSLSRVQSYYVTRGAFGVDESQNPSIKWLFGDKTRAYDKPLPVYNGGPVLTATLNYPEQSEDWNIYSAIGGGPVILHDGDVCFDYLMTPQNRYKTNYELLQDDIFGPNIYPQRTAVGYTADGDIILMVVDGRNVAGSRGVSLDQLARMMKGVGCVGALNLDGGGSTTMCVGASGSSKVVYNSSQRAVRSFVAITRK